MRTPSFALALLVAASSPANAQINVGGSGAAPADCTNIEQPPPPSPPGGGGQVPFPGSGLMTVVSPPPNLTDVPRNVEIRLAGDTGGLDLNPPTFLFELRGPDGGRIALSRTGPVAHPVTDLDAGKTYTVHVEPTDANPCPQCTIPVDVPFTTGATAKHDAPVLDATPSVNVFVMPDAADAAKCNIFLSETHQVVVDFGPGLFPDSVLIDIAGKTPAGDVKLIDEQFNTKFPTTFIGDLGPTLPVALGDPFVISLVARDLAGNVSEPRVLRVRARSFADENVARAELPALWCDLPASPTVSVPSALPVNGRVEVAFPFEEVPLALKASDGTETPLIPVADLDRDGARGHAYNTVEPMPQGRAFQVEALACPHCTCSGCDPAPGTILGGTVTATVAADRTAPAAPKVVDFDEDVNPAPSAGGSCHPDEPALLVVLDPGHDDTNAPLDLRYDAVVSVNAGPAFQLGRSLVPLARADGKHVLRVGTGGLGRLLGEDFTLTLDVVDSAGNRAETTAEHHVEAAKSGCSSTGSSSTTTCAFAFALGLLAALRARRRLR